MVMISTGEAARRAGCTRALIQKHAKNGRIVADGPNIDEASLATWMASRHPRVATPPPATACDDETPEAAAERIIIATGAPHDLAEAVRIKENYTALLKQLDYDQRSAKVAPIEDVARLVGEQFARVRTRLLALPAEQAPSLARCNGPAEVKDRLETLINRVLEELSEDGLQRGAAAAGAR